MCSFKYRYKYIYLIKLLQHVTLRLNLPLNSQPYHKPFFLQFLAMHKTIQTFSVQRFFRQIYYGSGSELTCCSFHTIIVFHFWRELIQHRQQDLSSHSMTQSGLCHEASVVTGRNNNYTERSPTRISKYLFNSELFKNGPLVSKCGEKIAIAKYKFPRSSSIQESLMYLFASKL